MPRDIVRFQANIPELVALEFATGKPCQGRFEDQIYYSLTNNRSTYVPLVVERRITELGIQPGEEFEICKQVRKEGRSNITRWIVGFPGQPQLNGVHGPIAVDKVQQPQAPVSSPSPVAAQRKPEAASLPAPSPVTLHPTSRRDHMASVLSDCVAATLTATRDLKLDNGNLQALISTLYIQEGRMEESKWRYPGSFAQSQPRSHVQVNGGIQ